MTRLRTLSPLVRNINTNAVQPRLVPKIKAEFYDSPQFRAWRTTVIARAGARCQAMDDHGLRCTKAWPQHRMYADHVVELKDGGSPLDVTNGQCLCSHHHQAKTHAVRKARQDHTWSGSYTQPTLPKPTCRVMLVCGPPAAGKSTFVRNNANPDDIIIDLDAIAHDRGYDRARPDDATIPLLRERNNRLAALANQPTNRVVWVILGAPGHQLRQWWCQALAVQPDDLVLLLPPRAELHRRVMHDPDRRAVVDLHLYWIDRWFMRETGRWPDVLASGG